MSYLTCQYCGSDNVCYDPETETYYCMDCCLVLYQTRISLSFCLCIWQLEIVDNYLLNDWGDYPILFNLLKFSDLWAVRDFYMIGSGVFFVCSLE